MRVQLLVAGGTYDSAYWRGYADYLADSGETTIAVDRPADLHRVVARLRSEGFDEFVVVGHSQGSAMAVDLAIRHPEDVDGLILTGFSNLADMAAFGALAEDTIVEGDRYRLAPGTRAKWFYHLPTADPDVVAADEAASPSEVIVDFADFPPPSEYARIKVPVLIVVGEHDRLMPCPDSATLLAAETPFWAPEARLEAVVIADTGHCVNLHRTAGEFFAVARDWTDRHFGRRG